MYQFDKALPVWGEGLTWEYNQVLGFRADVEAPKTSSDENRIGSKNVLPSICEWGDCGEWPGKNGKGFLPGG